MISEQTIEEQIETEKDQNVLPYYKKSIFSKVSGLWTRDHITSLPFLFDPGGGGGGGVLPYKGYKRLL